MHFDFAVVGFGLAGMSMTHKLRECGKTVLVISDESQLASSVAGGVWNPVILKRFTPAWRGDFLLKYALEFYKKLELDLNCSFMEYFETHRIIHDVEEGNNFIAASDRVGLENYLSPKILSNSNPEIRAPHGFGKVKGTGKLNVPLLLESYKSMLIKENVFVSGTIDYDHLDRENLSFQGHNFDNIVFCEGFGMAKNPFFNYLPLRHAKGEVLIIKCEALNLNVLLKAGVFILPLGSDMYKVGATYDNYDTTNTTTDKARVRLIEKLDLMINCTYEICDQLAGIRPTVVDRRPLVGKHPKYNNLFVLNGLGTRGVMNAPFSADNLTRSIVHGEDIDKEIDISRFS
jgi:glycine/D-amino acid oxidase-like deaminating enzyme